MALSIINTAAENSQQTFNNVLTFTSAAITLTVGDTVFVWVTWGSNTAGTANTGDITAFSDSQSNTWHRIGSTFYTSGTTEGVTGFALWWGNITTGGSSTFSVTISAGTWNTVGTRTLHLASAGYSNVFTPFFDATSTSATGTGTTLTTNNVTPTVNHDALLMIGFQGAGATQTMVAANTAWTQRFSGSTGTFLQELPWVGQGYSVGSAAGFISSPFGFTSTITSTVDWGAVVIAIPSVSTAALAMGDTAEVSAGDFQQFKQLFFVGDLFLGGYVGLAWMKNVFVLPRDHWDTALSTPYSGQLFPAGAGQGTPGQVFPF